jgi:hypothetical protein
MMSEVRRSIMYIAWTQTVQSRAAMLAARVKIETRWLLLTTAGEVSGAAAGARRDFVAQWPAIRNGRLPADEIGQHFYDIAADQAATFAALIIARRNNKGAK